MTSMHIEQQCAAQLLDENNADDQRTLTDLRSDPRVEFVDRIDAQLDTLRGLRPAPDAELLTESTRWAYFPWRRTAVSILGPRAFARVRLDRNRNLITAEEQQTLGRLRIGVVGLSVGHSVAYNLVAEGLCGHLRLTDFDDLELSNLNRVPATVFDLGENKAVVAARRIAELDPYLDVQARTDGLTLDNVDEFLDGLDILIEECDSLDVKTLVRERARARRLPVLMATSDRGLVDVERFDLEPGRAIFHGLLGDLDTAALADLTNEQKIPHVLRIIDAKRLSTRGAASLVEVGHTLSTWPQLAGDVALGATAVGEAVRRIGLAEPLSSGRVRVDMAAMLDRLDDPAALVADSGAADQPPQQPTPADVVGTIAAAAARAPSGGNAQPWHIATARDGLSIEIAPEHTSTMDVAFRGSAVAIGAAVFNARVAAAAHGKHVRVRYTEDGSAPLRATLSLDADSPGPDQELAPWYSAMLKRETNRHRGAAAPISDATLTTLQTMAERHGGRLRLLTDRSDIDSAGAILAATDRIRYLTPRLHADMASELRWPGEPLDSGIDVATLELDPGALLTLDILRRPEVMATLADWDGGAALGADTRDRLRSSAALAVVTVTGTDLVDYARGGAAAEAVWVAAQDCGLAVQPMSPVFLYAHTCDELRTLSDEFARPLHDLRSDLRSLAGVGSDESTVLLLRLTVAPPATVRSRRRRPGGADDLPLL